MDVKDLRLIYKRLLKDHVGIMEDDRARALFAVEREIRLKKMVPAFTGEKNNEIYLKFMSED
jgi:hypothetical protein